MRSVRVLTAMLAGAMLLGVATLATASAARDEGGLTTAVLPASHEPDEDENGLQGPPPDRGPPDGVGGGRALGLTGAHGGLHGPPELPAHASARAHAAVQLAFERQEAIRDRIDQIHALPSGPGKGQAVSELMRHFGQLFQLTNDAVDGEDV